MSIYSDVAGKPYPNDLIEVSELPDEAPREHPTPWTLKSGGNGHVYLYDARMVKVAHIHCYDAIEATLLEQKLLSINGVATNVRTWV